MVKQLLEGLQNNFSDHSVAISKKISIFNNDIFFQTKESLPYKSAQSRAT